MGKAPGSKARPFTKTQMVKAVLTSVCYQPLKIRLAVAWAIVTAKYRAEEE